MHVYSIRLEEDGTVPHKRLFCSNSVLQCIIHISLYIAKTVMNICKYTVIALIAQPT